jgi:hypothetical protein
MHGLLCMFKVVLFTKTNDLVADALVLATRSSAFLLPFKDGLRLISSPFNSNLLA